jgi:hypothetical protein
VARNNQVNNGGINPALGFDGSTVWHTGGAAAVTATQGTDTTPVVTETYVCRVFIPHNCALTGVSLLNGSAVSGNITVGLADSKGNMLASSASTAQSGTAAYQKVPFSAQINVKGPAEYFMVLQVDNTTARFRSHTLGNFKAGKLTGQTYGTLPNFTPPTGFTASLGPIADTY